MDIQMWRGIIPLSNASLKEFENTFHFNIDTSLREYLLEHNGGIPTFGTFPTAGKERKIARILDFSDRDLADGAWAVNRRLRNRIGEKRIIIGTDSLGNFVCLERDYRRQYIVLWNHLTDGFEESLWDIPAFLRGIG